MRDFHILLYNWCPYSWWQLVSIPSIHWWPSWYKNAFSPRSLVCSASLWSEKKPQNVQCLQYKLYWVKMLEPVSWMKTLCLFSYTICFVSTKKEKKDTSKMVNIQWLCVSEDNHYSNFNKFNCLPGRTGLQQVVPPCGVYSAPHMQSTAFSWSSDLPIGRSMSTSPSPTYSVKKVNTWFS